MTSLASGWTRKVRLSASCNLADDLGGTPAALTLIMQLWPMGSGRFCMRVALFITVDPEQRGFDCGFTYSDFLHLTDAIQLTWAVKTQVMQGSAGRWQSACGELT